MTRQGSTLVIVPACLAALACSPPGPPVHVSAGDLYASYLRNAAVADQQYRGRTLVVDGMSGGIDKEGTRYVLTIVPGIRAHLGSRTEGANLFQRVVVRCSGIASQDGNINLEGCVIEGGNPAAPG